MKSPKDRTELVTRPDAGQHAYAQFRNEDHGLLAKTLAPTLKKEGLSTITLLGCDTCEGFAENVKKSLREEQGVKNVDVRILDKRSMGLPADENTFLYGVQPDGRMTFMAKNDPQRVFTVDGSNLLKTTKSAGLVTNSILFC